MDQNPRQSLGADSGRSHVDAGRFERSTPRAATVPVNCPDCGEGAMVPRAAIGRRAKCNRCGAVFTILTEVDHTLPSVAEAAAIVPAVRASAAIVASRRPTSTSSYPAQQAAERQPRTRQAMLVLTGCAVVAVFTIGFMLLLSRRGGNGSDLGRAEREGSERVDPVPTPDGPPSAPARATGESAKQQEPRTYEQRNLLAREEAERRAKEERERIARQEAEAAAQKQRDRLAREDAERRAKEERERIARQEAERTVRFVIAGVEGNDRVTAGDAWEAARKQLTELGPLAIEPLSSSLQHPVPGVRAMVAEVLGERKDKQAIEHLVRILRDKDTSVRMAAADALGKIKDNSAVEPLCAMLWDEDPRARPSAAKAIGEISDRRAIESLVKVAVDENLSAEAEKARVVDVRPVAIRVLERMKASSSAKALAGVLVRNYSNDVGTTCRGALEALGWTPSTARERMCFRLSDKDYVASEWNDVRTMLLADIRSDDVQLRQNAIDSLMHINKPETMPHLVEVLNRHGDKRLAEIYLNSGKPILEQAARGWAQRHGYIVR